MISILLILNLLLYGLARFCVICLEWIYSFFYLNLYRKEKDLRNSESYEEYMEKAKLLDLDLGSEEWKVLFTKP